MTVAAYTSAKNDPDVMAAHMAASYYRQQPERVRELARDATMDAIRKHLAEIVAQYERLAEGAGLRNSEHDVE